MEIVCELADIEQDFIVLDVWLLGVEQGGQYKVRFGRLVVVKG